MPCQATQVTEILEQAAPARNKGQLLPFTRHPRLLARVHRLYLQACAMRVLEVLLTYADDDGVCWPQPDEIVQLMPRSAHVKAYSIASVLRGLRTLRTMGLLSWTAVPAFGRFPGRVRGKRVWRAGKATSSGGRVWEINLAKLRGQPLTRPALSNAGTELGGAITHDRPRSITHDRPSDPLLLSEKLKIDPARQTETRAPQTPPASHVASETPRTAPTGRRDENARPSAAQVASETPCAAAAASPPRHRPAPHGENERHEGAQEQNPSHVRRQRMGEPLTSAQEQERALSKICAVLGVTDLRLRR
jgi:hypothetical protein